MRSNTNERSDVMPTEAHTTSISLAALGIRAPNGNPGIEDMVLQKIKIDNHTPQIAISPTLKHQLESLRAKAEKNKFRLSAKLVNQWIINLVTLHFETVDVDINLHSGSPDYYLFNINKYDLVNAAGLICYGASNKRVATIDPWDWFLLKHIPDASALESNPFTRLFIIDDGKPRN